MRNTEGKDCCFVSLLLDCLAEVPERYYLAVQPTTRNHYPVVSTDAQVFYERRFAMALFAEIYNRLGFQDYFIDCEVRKRFDYTQNIIDVGSFRRTKCILNRILERENAGEKRNYCDFFPDLVIHRGQHLNNPSDQGLAVELKGTFSEASFWWDVFKCNVYVDEFNFPKSIFIIIGLSAKNVRELAIKYIEQGFYISGNPGRVLIAVKESFSSQHSLFSLDELL